MTLYRILSGQYIIQNCELKHHEKEKIENELMNFAQDPDLDYNLRADSADVILKLGSDNNKLTAREIIMMLGRETGEGKTIFDNAQNVHVDKIEESVLEILEFLSGLNIMKIKDSPITFEYAKKQIDDLLKKEKPDEKSQDMKLWEDKVDKINISLNRIYLDRALYSSFNCSLLYILLKIWSYITPHKFVEEMKQRLIEELVDMSGTCSTGFASRLANVISGFGEFNIRISWRDQIVANFTGRLNAKIRNITDENLKGLIFEEMTIKTYNFAERKNFLRFFRKNMLGIREELYQEFCNHITDTDYDLYFRAAISIYETGEYI